jgi:hypothetical protein
MVLLALAACAVCGAAIWVALMVRSSGRAHSTAGRARRRAVPPSREEDRVRPAVGPTGERIWLEQDEVFWHEIVCWPVRPPTSRRADRSAG